MQFKRESVVLSIQEIKQTKVIICKSISRTSFWGQMLDLVKRKDVERNDASHFSLFLQERNIQDKIEHRFPSHAPRICCPIYPRNKTNKSNHLQIHFTYLILGANVGFI
jgi:hypothetical protein